MLEELLFCPSMAILMCLCKLSLSYMKPLSSNLTSGISKQLLIFDMLAGDTFLVFKQQNFYDIFVSVQLKTM